MKSLNLLLFRIVLLSTIIVNFTFAKGKPPKDDGGPTAGTLEEIYSNMKSMMPLENMNETPNNPTQENLNDFVLIVSSMMNNEKCTSINLLSLRRKYELIEILDTDTNKKYCILQSLGRKNTSLYPWGNIIIYQDTTTSPPPKNLSIDCPHPLNDSTTGEQGIGIFKRTNAKSFIVSGSHRKATSTLSECQGNLNYEVADAAHNTNNAFHSAVIAIQLYYDQNFWDYTSIQFHGMGKLTCGNIDIFLTHGSRDVAVPTDKISILEGKIKEEFTEEIPLTEIPDGDDVCGLYGTTNTQGRLLNNVDNGNVCSKAATEVTQRFIHIEQKIKYRSSDRYNEWATAINNAYLEWYGTRRGRKQMLRH